MSTGQWVGVTILAAMCAPVLIVETVRALLWAEDCIVGALANLLIAADQREPERDLRQMSTWDAAAAVEMAPFFASWDELVEREVVTIPWRSQRQVVALIAPPRDCRGCDDELIALADETTKTCHKCKRRLRVGESAWADDWTLIEAEGVRTEVRYTCDDCEALR